MTTAEKYRQLEKSAVINTARYIFHSIKETSKITSIGDELEEIKTGKTPSKQEKRFYEDDYFNWFKPDEIGSEKYLYEASDKVSKYAVESNQVTLYEPDTILINAIGDIGRVSILKNKASSNQQITGIRFKSSVLPEYAYYYLVSNRDFFYIDLFKTTLPIINQKKIFTIPLLLPELEKQRRIATGLEVIEKIHQIEDIQIIDSIDWINEYKNACRFFFKLQFNSEKMVNEHTNQLNILKNLRQQILQDAVQGKLVPQDPNDEPASKLLERIKAEKEKLIGEKKIKEGKPLPDIKPEELTFEIPENWVWCRLGEICTKISDGDHLTPPRIAEGRMLLSAKNIRDGFIDFKNIDFISEDHFQKSISRCNPQMHDILIVSVGATIGRSAILEVEEEFAIVRSVALIKPLSLIDNKYIKIILDSPLLQKDINERAWGTAQPCLYLNQINELSIPLPPITEQHRIVIKIEQLMKLCDELEQTIQQNQKYTQELLQVALKEALEPK